MLVREDDIMILHALSSISSNPNTIAIAIQQQRAHKNRGKKNIPRVQSQDDEQFSGTTKLWLARQLQVHLLVTDAFCPSSDKEIDEVSIFCMCKSKGIYIVSLRETNYNKNVE